MKSFRPLKVYIFEIYNDMSHDVESMLQRKLDIFFGIKTSKTAISQEPSMEKT